MIQVVYHADGTQTYKRDGEEISRREYLRQTQRRNRLHGGIGEMCKAGAAPVADTDEVHVRINRSGLMEHEKAYIAKKARERGLNETCAYDPTTGCGTYFYESRKQVDRAIAEARERAAINDGRPKYRLNPRHVQSIKRHMIEQDPSLKARDQRELEAEIIERHAPPE